MPFGTSNLFAFNSSGATLASWISAYRTGCTIVGFENPLWTGSGYNQPLHKQAFIDYLASKNVSVVRIMVCWESFQPTAMGAFDSTYTAKVKALVDMFLAKGIYVQINPWQYSTSSGDTDITYKGVAFTSAMFSDFWSKLAAVFSYDQRICFDLINEPHLPDSGSGIVGITLNNWFSYAQSAVNAIRATGATNYIAIQGMNYADPGTWVSNGSAAKFVAMTDTLSPKRLIVGTHNYGTNYTASIINLKSNLYAIVADARANGYKFFVETDCSLNPAENPASSTTVSNWADVTTYMKSNSDVCLGWSWWAADDNTIAGWGTDYYHWSLTAPGTNNVNSQWMDLIQGTLGSSSGGGGGGGSTYPSNPATGYSTNTQYTMTAPDGITSYYVIPSTYDSTHNTPIGLLVLCHGCGGRSQYDVAYFSPSFNGFNNSANLPATIAQTWITLGVGGREGACWDWTGADDSKITNAIAYVKTRFNIDTKRIYFGGYSSGGDIGYPYIFHNASVFAGAFFCNTAPFDSVSGGDAASDTAPTNLAASGYNSTGGVYFPIYHITHTSDTTYPPLALTHYPGVNSEISTLVSAGWSVTKTELPGTHFDSVGGDGDPSLVPTTGNHSTNRDIYQYALPNLNLSSWKKP